MAGKIVLFGATGYTGRLVAQQLLVRGAQPVLAGRDRARLEQLRDELGVDLELAVADVQRPESVRGLVVSGNVLVATVGPFARFGAPAVEAAIEAGATYLDSTGEAAFIRDVFESYGSRAEATEAALLTAIGYDWVPGNLAGALALREAGDDAVALDLGYFTTGEGNFGMSGGTRASGLYSMLQPGFAYRDGRIVSERAGKRARKFTVNGTTRPAMSVSSTEHYSLPRLHPALREVGTYLGWFDSATPAIRLVNAAVAGIASLPGARTALTRLAGRVAKGSTGGPGEEERAATRSYLVAIAKDAQENTLAEVALEGVNPYTFTAAILAWSALEAATRGVEGTGALGPVEAFGLEQLERGAQEAGMNRITSTPEAARA